MPPRYSTSSTRRAQEQEAAKRAAEVAQKAADAYQAKLAEEWRLTFIGGFRRSWKGNLTRLWEGYRLTVFCYDPDFGDEFGFCICELSDPNEPRYSEERFDSETDALDSLWHELQYHTDCPALEPEED